MAVDGGLGVLLLQLFQEMQQRGLLGGGAGVLGFTLAVETADITDAYGMGIMAFAVGTYLLDWPTLVDCPVESDQEMIAYRYKAPLNVPLAHLLHGNGPPLGRGGTVHNQQIHLASHFSHF